MRLFVLCSLMVIGGCAANPGPAPVSDAAAASAQAAASSPAAPAEKASNLPLNMPPGFKPTRISGELFYCRKMVVLGSRFPKQLCLTEEQLKQHVAGTEEMKRNKDQISHVCTSTAGCAVQ
ncbi:MAG TPA: hypothetical protein VJT80_06975 [Steroidobacteraceae bacterium]|nr:hypothetical protein [Steroidobacteraceae bacterium]